MTDQMPGELTRDRALSIHKAIEALQHFIQEDSSRPWEAGFTMGGTPCCRRPGFELHWVVDGLFQCVIISTRYRICGNGGTPRAALEDAAKQLLDFRDELNRYVEAI